ncbi:MAG: poly-beta-1,6 N-acetyl-D-glucosamine export porin PgaA, partial [Noviherbaspirillum sp.]
MGFSRANCLCWLFACGIAHAAISPDEYEAAIRDARAGNTGAALDKLEDWHRASPSDKRILYDLVAVLEMAGRHEAALQYYARFAHVDAPPYVTKAGAGAARATGRTAEAEIAYRLLLNKTPNDAEAHVGLIYTWMAQDRIQESLEYLNAHLRVRPHTRREVPLLIALAELHERRRDWLQAAAAYQDVLRVEPDFRYALHGRVFALNRAGAFHLAKRLADSRPQAFSAEEMRRFAHDAAAQSVVFGEVQLAVDDKMSRFAATDHALRQNAEVTRQFGETPSTQFDRVVALRDRTRMREAAALYESLAAHALDIPPYAKAAAADAYLHLEQPETARDLYRSALDDSTGGANAADWQIALMYAYGETEQHDAAEALADRLLQVTPVLANKGIRGIESSSDEYARAALMAAQTRLYADRLEQAESRLAELRARAPFNSGIRAAWASLQSSRERPRAANEEFTRLQRDDPRSITAAVGRAESLIALNQLDEAREALAPSRASHADNKAVQNLVRRLESHDRLQLKIDATLGRGGSIAGAESVLNATLHSPPLTGSVGSRHRIFSRLSRTDGDARGTSVTRTRLGAGMDYRARDMQAEVEVNHAGGPVGRNGLVLALAWSLSDAWHAGLVLDTNVNDLSAVAFRDGIT